MKAVILAGIGTNDHANSSAVLPTAAVASGLSRTRTLSNVYHILTPKMYHRLQPLQVVYLKILTPNLAPSSKYLLLCEDS